MGCGLVVCFFGAASYRVMILLFSSVILISVVAGGVNFEGCFMLLWRGPNVRNILAPGGSMRTSQVQIDTEDLWAWVSLLPTKLAISSLRLNPEP